jgi:hypothetical protein
MKVGLEAGELERVHEMVVSVAWSEGLGGGMQCIPRREE